MVPEDNKPTEPTDSKLGTSTSEPTSPEAPGGFTSTITGGKVKNRKKLYIGIGVAVVFVGAAVAGWFMYNQPRRVLADALGKILGTQNSTLNGNVTYTTKGSGTSVKVAIDFTGKGSKGNSQLDAKGKLTIGAVDVNLDTSFLSADKEAYFKINNAKQIGDLINTMASSSYKGLVSTYTPLLTKIDNKWIKIDQKDASAEMNKCTTALNSFVVSKNDQKAIGKLFSNNQFIKAKKAGGDTFSESHYNLTFDKNAVSPFLTGVENLNSFKTIKDACGTDTAVNQLKSDATSATPSDTKTTAELWVNKWTHKPTKVIFTAEDNQAKLVLTSNIDLGKKVTISKPSSSTNLSDVVKDFQTELLQNALKNPTGSSLDQSQLEQLLKDSGNLQ